MDIARGAHAGWPARANKENRSPTWQLATLIHIFDSPSGRRAYCRDFRFRFRFPCRRRRQCDKALSIPVLQCKSKVKFTELTGGHAGAAAQKNAVGPPQNGHVESITTLEPSIIPIIIQWAGTLRVVVVVRAYLIRLVIASIHTFVSRIHSRAGFFYFIAARPFDWECFLLCGVLCNIRFDVRINYTNKSRAECARVVAFNKRVCKHCANYVIQHRRMAGLTHEGRYGRTDALVHQRTQHQQQRRRRRPHRHPISDQSITRFCITLRARARAPSKIIYHIRPQRTWQISQSETTALAKPMWLWYFPISSYLKIYIRTTTSLELITIIARPTESCSGIQKRNQHSTATGWNVEQMQLID